VEKTNETLDAYFIDVDMARPKKYYTYMIHG